MKRTFRTIGIFLLALTGLAVVFSVVFWGWFGPVVLFLMLKGMAVGSLEMFSSSIREEPQPWEIISPGKPMPEYPTPYILQRGTGEAVQIGDIVTVHKYQLTDDATQLKKDMGRVWFWVGFTVRNKDDPYAKCYDDESCEVESGVIGMPTGSWFYYPIRDKLVMMGPDAKGKWRHRLTDWVSGGGGVRHDLWGQNPFFEVQKYTQPEARLPAAPIERRPQPWGAGDGSAHAVVPGGATLPGAVAYPDRQNQLPWPHGHGRLV
ncbi:MAG: hypothetical protein Q4G39_03990 [Brachymonas sp.]|nr:hypothetical protein [Brachymonas sp.]